MNLTPEIIAILTLDIVFFVFGIFAFFISLQIVKNWDLNKTTQYQYKLEKKSILVATIIKYIFLLKIPLFVFFVFTADKISNVITGAMCAAGVVNSVSFGLPLFVFKIINLFIFGFWIALHKLDMNNESLKFTKLKFYIFIAAFILLILEIWYELSFFMALDVDKIVSCCGTLFSVASSSSISIIFSIPNSVVVTVFYISLASIIIGYFIKNELFFVISNLLFFIISIISLILFFGTYIYELPTHHCPFCFLQKEYHYVGYLLYATLFAGTFSGISGGILSLLEKNYPKKYFFYSLLFNLAYSFIITAYVLVYYLKNGVWL
ncbi:hypothetical protein ACKGJI_02715 [Sulfurospirillum sp. 1307]